MIDKNLSMQAFEVCKYRINAVIGQGRLLLKMKGGAQ